MSLTEEIKNDSISELVARSSGTAWIGTKSSLPTNPKLTILDVKFCISIVHGSESQNVIVSWITKRMLCPFVEDVRHYINVLFKTRTLEKVCFKSQIVVII